MKEKEKYVQQENYKKAEEVKEKVAVLQDEFDVLLENEKNCSDIEEVVYCRSLAIIENLLRYFFILFSSVILPRIYPHQKSNTPNETPKFIPSPFLPPPSPSGTKMSLQNPEVVSLLETLLLPAIFQGTSSPVREKGLRCLGIYCLLDRLVWVDV